VNYILDTNVVSELGKQNPDHHVVQWVGSIDPASVFLSVITVGELTKGIEKLPDSRRKAKLASWLEEDLLVRFGERILPLDTSVLLTWGQMTADLEKKGRPMPAIDSLLAATAAQTGYTLVTRNTGDFESSEIPVVNPWEPPSA